GRYTRFSRDWSSDVCSSDLRIPRQSFDRCSSALRQALEGSSKNSGRTLEESSKQDARRYLPFHQRYGSLVGGLSKRTRTNSTTQIGRASRREREGLLTRATS